MSEETWSDHEDLRTADHEDQRTAATGSYDIVMRLFLEALQRTIEDER